jgi:hypothetical protein
MLLPQRTLKGLGFLLVLSGMISGCGGSASTTPTTSTPTSSPTPSTTSTQTLTAASGGTATLPASSGISGATVSFPAAASLPSGVSVVFSSAGSLAPPAAQSKTRKPLSASALAFWQMTFTGSTLQGVTFNGNITVTIPTPSGLTGTSLLLEVFDGTTLGAACSSAVSGSNTVFTCSNPQLNLGDTYWIEIVTGSALAATSSCIVQIAASPAGPHLLYYTDAGNNAVRSFDVCAQPSSGITATFTLPSGTLSGSVADSGEIRFDRGSAAGDPRVFVLGANNTLVYLDVSTAPGTILATVPFSGTPHHFAVTDVGTTPELLYVTVGNSTLESFTVSQTSPYLTSGPSLTTLTGPRGIGLEGNVAGTYNDMLVANFGGGTVAAVNRTTLAIDSTVTLGGEPQRVTGPNAGLNCAVVTNAANNSAYGVSIVAPGGTVAAIGSPVTLPSAALYDTFFPPGTPGTGTPGYGGNTAIVALAGAAQLLTCTGTTFTAGPLWSSFPSAPSGLGQSNYSSTAVDSLVYVVGANNGTPVLQGYTATQDSPVFSINLAAGINPQDVSAGP